MPRAVVFGEALIDVFPEQELVAGAPLHVAVHLAARGWTTWFVTRVGADERGERIRALLAEYGVETALVEVDRELPTGHVTVELADAGHSFVIHRPAAWDVIEGPERLPPHDAFCYGTLAARSQRSRATLERLLAASPAPLRALDVNLRPPDVDAGVLRIALARATLVKLNGEEFDAVAEILRLPAAPDAYFRAAPALEWLCVTRGEAGAELYARSGERWTVPGAAVTVVDTVGAGDAFAAGLVEARARGLSAPEALELAQAAAASVLGRRGGLPPLRA